jgi:hypothetical protein
MARSHSRKHHKRSSRRRRSTRRRQQGGGSCAYMPQLNRQAIQMGGMSPMESAYGTLLDGPTAIQAQVGPLNAAFAELSHVIPKQAGGRRRSRRRSHRRRSHRRHQQGGMSPFESAFPSISQQPAGGNAQFVTEDVVNKLYGNFGAQH